MNPKLGKASSFVLVFSFLAGCVGAPSTPNAPAGQPAPTTSLASGDQILQDPETGRFRSIPPRDGDSRPTDARLSAQGRWLTPFDGQIPAVSMAVLPDRRILYWTGAEEEGAGWTHWPGGNYPFNSSESRILDLSQATPRITKPVHAFDIKNEDIFCSGFTMLPDGRILGAGGSYWYHEGEPLTQGGATGLFTARIFDPSNDTWFDVGRLTLGRWYPTLFTAPNGQALAASGIGFLVDPRTHWDSFEAYDPPTNDWSVLPGTKGHSLPLYPHLHVLPGGPLEGHALFAASGTLWGPFGEHPQQEEWSYLQSHDLATDTWSRYGRSQYGARNYAGTVLLPGDPVKDYAPTILSTGGTLFQSAVAVPFTEIIDASTKPPTSREGPPLNHARWHHQTVLLPDGSALVVGGGMTDSGVIWGPTNVPVMEAELYDPQTRTWRRMAPMSVERMYHSTASLLPDGRVLVGGHVPLPAPTELERTTVRKSIVETRFEIYEPGYLFRGARPVISSAPIEVGFGEEFFIEVESDAPIASVMMMRPSATTHAWDANQRATLLEIVEKIEGGLIVRAPPSGAASPPGPHMLFVNKVADWGPVPSVAAMVSLGVAKSQPNEVVEI